MTVSYRTAITIVQFIFFTPAAPLALWLSFKDGIRQANTWRFVCTLSLLRIAGSISYFVSLSHPGINIEGAVIVCELVGIAPLMLILVAFVARANKTTKSYPRRASLIITFASLTGLVLGIVGTDRVMEDASSENDVGSDNLVKVALALFIAGYGLMFLGFCWVVLDVIIHPAKRVALGKEIGLLYTVGLASPFVLVRFIYSALGDYTGDRRFSVLYGNNTVYLFMDVLMEIFSVVICLSSAFFVPAPPKKPKKEKKAKKAKSGDHEDVQRSDGTASRGTEKQELTSTNMPGEEEEEAIELGSGSKDTSEAEETATSSGRGQD